LASGAYAPVNARGIGSGCGKLLSRPTVHRRKYALAPGVGSVSRLDAKTTRRLSGVHPRAQSTAGW
jgi:hypothetical protein